MDKIRFWEISGTWVGETSLAPRFPVRYRMTNTHIVSILLYDQRRILLG